MKRPNMNKVRQNARERIFILLTLAKDKALASMQTLADRYVHLSRKLAMKARVPVPNEFKGQYCRHCSTFLIPSKNARVRLRKGWVIYWCLSCKKYTKFSYKQQSNLNEKGKR